MAVDAGYSETVFNKILNARRPLPPDFIARAYRAIDVLDGSAVGVGARDD